MTRQGWLRGAAQVMWEGRRRALLGGLRGMRRERRGDGRHGTTPVGLGATGWFGGFLSSGGLAACWLAAVVRVWGGAGRLFWITSGAPSLPSLLAPLFVSSHLSCLCRLPRYSTFLIFVWLVTPLISNRLVSKHGDTFAVFACPLFCVCRLPRYSTFLIFSWRIKTF